MFKRHLVVLIVCFFCIPFCFAQNKISGMVTDTLKKPLANANVSLKNKNLIIKYTKTDASGAFSFIVEPTNSIADLSLEARLLGYIPTQINLLANQTAYNFTLKDGSIDLSAVNVKYKPVIIVKGDTTNYRTADFANQDDRSIGDVLKKIPGIAVSENGKVTINNKPITQLYIDGDNLLDDKYNIGTKSIPYKAVTKVQVIDHDQPIKMLQKNNLSNDVAINLVIDKNAKLKVIGNASLGAGLPDKYQENADFIIFKDRFKFLDNIAFNNTSIDLSEDVISHNNSLQTNAADNNRPGFITSTGIGNTPYLPKNRYLINNTTIVNTNNLYKLTKEKQLKANIYYLYDRQNQFNNYSNQIALPNQNIFFAENQRNKAINQSIFSKLNYIDNAAKHYINNGLTIDYSPKNHDGSINGQALPFKEYLQQRRLNLVNNLQYLQTLKSGTILNITSYLEKTAQSEFLAISPGINDSILNNNNPYSQLNQKLNIPGFFTNNFINYSFQIGKITQSYQTGFSYQAIDFNTVLTQSQNNQSISTYPNGINNVNWNKFKAYINPGLDYKTDHIHLGFRVPLSLNFLQYNVYDSRFTKVFVNPGVFIRYTINQENKLDASYSFTDNMGRVDDIYTGIILQNYRSLITNNVPLPFTKSNRVSLGYEFKKSIRFLFANIQMSYTNTLLDNIADNTITNSIQTRNVIALNNNLNSLTINGNIGKYFSGISTSVSFNGGLTKSDGKLLQNKSLFGYINKSLTLGINVNTKINKNINLIYIANYTNGTTQIAKIEGPKTDQARQYVTLNTTVFKRITFGTKLNHLYLKQTKQPSLNYLFSDINLKYKLLKIKTDFELGLNNLGNIKSFSTYYSSLNSFTAANYSIPGRNVVLKAVFAFN